MQLLKVIGENFIYHKLRGHFNSTERIEFEDINNMAIKQQAGLRYSSPKGIIFMPGFFSQLIVKALKVLNVCTTILYEVMLKTKQLCLEDIRKMYQNGAVLRCPGLFHGELVVAIDEEHSSIIYAMQGSNLDRDYVSSIFTKVVKRRFKQCIFLLVFFIERKKKL